MQAIRLLKKVALIFILLHGNSVVALSQNLSWMKGLWKEESGTPYTVPTVKCMNTLQITAAADTTFNGLQATFFAADTTIKIVYDCNGILTKTKAQFTRSNLVYKNNSIHPRYKWTDCGTCDSHTCSLYVAQNKIILLLNNKDCDSACNGTITYYRNLEEFDTITQRHLVTLYSKPSYTTVLTSAASPNTTLPNARLALPEQTNKLETDSAINNSSLPLVLRERTNKLAQILQISSPNIEVILLDDAEIDGDIVSLFHNNTEVLSHKTLGREVIKYSFKADPQHTRHEIILVAENLGSIPPNTALMRIRAGDKKYELTTRANMHENAKVIIEYSGKE